MKKKLIFFISMIGLIFIFSSLKVEASVKDKNLAEYFSNIEGKYILSNEKIELVVSDMKKRFEYSEDEIYFCNYKKMLDYSGNEYELVEFSPTGYAIYSKDFSSLLEISQKAISPYINYNENLIYLGAQNYYIYDNLSFKLTHCIYDEEIELTNHNQEELMSFSNKMNYSIKKTISNNKLNYAKYASGEETASISQPDIIKYANTHSFNENNNCGYVAAALLVFYAAKAWGYNYLFEPDSISIDLVSSIQGDRNPDSWAPDIEGALNDYLNEKGYDKLAKVNMWHLPAHHTFYDRVLEDKPVALFGKVPRVGLSEKVDHVVVVYKVKRNFYQNFLGIRSYSNYEFTTHYGWDLTENEIILSADAITIAGLVNIHK